VRGAQLVCILLLLCVGSSSSCRWGGRSRALGPDDYAVYSALLRANSGAMGSAFPSFAFVSTTQDCPPLAEQYLRDWDSARAPIAALREANDDYRARCGHPLPIERFPGLPADWPLLRWTQIDSAYSAPYDTSRWLPFRRHYPQVSGYTGVSCVGFSRDRGCALLHTYSYSGFLTGGSTWWLLSRQGQEWKVLGPIGDTRMRS
jgi:hypothetical protein